MKPFLTKVLNITQNAFSLWKTEIVCHPYRTKVDCSYSGKGAGKPGDYCSSANCWRARTAGVTQRESGQPAQPRCEDEERGRRDCCCLCQQIYDSSSELRELHTLLSQLCETQGQELWLSLRPCKTCWWRTNPIFLLRSEDLDVFLVRGIWTIFNRKGGDPMPLPPPGRSVEIRSRIKWKFF